MTNHYDEFADYCLELLSGLHLGEIQRKKMFGGVNFAIDGKTFGIIAFNALWLKADESSREAFLNAGSRIFTYEADGKVRTMGYYAAPQDAMESAALMRPWAMLAWDAALRAANKTSAKKRVSTARARTAPRAPKQSSSSS